LYLNSSEWQSNKTAYVLCNDKPYFGHTRPSSGRTETCRILLAHLMYCCVWWWFTN
jgi:hypothetical protein